MRTPVLLLVVVLAASGLSLAATPVEREASYVLLTDAVSSGTANVDGVLDVAPASSVGAAFNRLRAAVDERRNSGSPYEVGLSVAAGASNWTGVATWSRVREAPPVTFHAVLIGNASMRFHELERRDLEADATADVVETRFTLPASRDALGVVVFARASEAAGRYQSGEVLQSATWLAGQDGPSVQRAKAPLVLHATGGDCAACPAADEAVLLLATQTGFPLDAVSSTASYLQPFGARAAIGLALGALVGIGLVRRRP